MRTVRLLRQHAENFKGISNQTIDFNKGKTTISGQNATGKSTTRDAHYWLLFGENADGDTKFGIRPVDTNGDKIHNTVILVSEQFEIMSDDGATENHTITKSQKENWVKKRGNDEATLQGNVNSYDIDGYPKSEAEFNRWVEENLCSEEIGKILSSPEYFPSMPWKDQRNILFKAVSPMSDYEIAHNDGHFVEIESELKVAGDADTVRQKYAKSLKELKKTQEELPVRIDEISKQKRLVDKARLDEINEQVSMTDKVLEQSKKREEELKKSTDDLIQIQFDYNDLLRQLDEHKNAVSNQLKDCIASAQRTIRDDEHEKQVNASDREKINGDNAVLEVGIKNNQRGYNDCLSKKVRVDDTCPYCGQKLPEEKIADALKRAEEEHNNDLDGWQKNIKDFSDSLNENCIELDRLNERDAELDKEIADLQKHIEDWQKALDGATPVSDPELENQIKQKSAWIEKGRSELSQLRQLQDEMASLEGQKQSFLDEKAAINNIIEVNTSIDIRVKELRAEQLDTAQKVADCEKVIDLLDKFTKRKANIISNEINSKFSLASFKLFETQINGGIKPTCELQYKGVSYGDLNFGSKLKVGLDLIDGLSRIFEVSLPTFLDFAESVNEKNVPSIEGQLIELRVTDEKTLTVH